MNKDRDYYREFLHMYDISAEDSTSFLNLATPEARSQIVRQRKQHAKEKLKNCSLSSFRKRIGIE